MKKLYILGGTGTIGHQTIEVIKNHSNHFKVIGLSLGRSKKAQHGEIIQTLKPEIVCLREKDFKLESKFPQIKFVYQDEGLVELVKYPKVGIVVNGISGSAGLIPTIEAIKSGKDIALANKETLVMAGEIVGQLVEKHAVKLYPIDSEHNAILSALRGETLKEVKSITITASGGSLRDLSREELKNVTVEEALNHPNWKMGKKITIDSATMINKGLEVIEAHHLFNLAYENIHTVIHPESIVHGFVTFVDNSVKAVLAKPNMKMPILYALSYPKHLASGIENLDLTNLALTFEPIDYQRYPLLKYSYQAGKKGGLYPVVLNAANEAAVKLFLNKKITFLQIEEIVIEELENFKTNVSKPTLNQIITLDKNIQRKVLKKYEFST